MLNATKYLIAVPRLAEEVRLRAQLEGATSGVETAAAARGVKCEIRYPERSGHTRLQFYRADDFYPAAYFFPHAFCALVFSRICLPPG